MTRYLLDVTAMIFISGCIIEGIKFYGKVQYNKGFEAGKNTPVVIKEV